LATRFTPLATTDSRLLGIRVEGTVGRADRQHLLDLAGKCLEKGRTHLILDFTGLKTIGGTGAAILADLQRQLGEQGGEVVFVGAGETVRRFLDKRFENLPLRCFEDLDGAEAAFAGDGVAGTPEPPVLAAVSETDAVVAMAAATPSRPAPASGGGSLDSLLEEVSSEGADHLEERRRTAELVSAVYLSLDEAVGALGSLDNPAAFGEALGKLLHGNDIAEETLYCHRDGDAFVAVDGSCQLPACGAVVSALTRTGRPLSLLDLEDGELTPDETTLLEGLQPDLLLPVAWDGDLQGVALLQRARGHQEYGLSEIFAMELLLRLLAEGRRSLAADRSPAAAEPRMCLVDGCGASLAPDAALLEAQFRLLRALDTAQDEPHFWQIGIGCLEDLADVDSLLCVDPSREEPVTFAAGTARGTDLDLDLAGERLAAFYRALERPVEVCNMPVSFAEVRDALLERGLHWVVGLNTERRRLGAVFLGLDWRVETAEPAAALQDLMAIVADALARTREAERRADRELGLVEELVARHEASAGEGDRVTRHVARGMRLLAREMGLPRDQERDLVLGALLRDVGQNPVLTVDAPGATDRDHPAWESRRAHPDTGADLLASLRAPAGIRDAVRHHHERFDGRGYPAGLKGREIPLAARMVALVEHFALCAAQATDPDDAVGAGLDAVCRDAGRSLDPDLVDLFQRSLRRDASVLLSA